MKWLRQNLQLKILALIITVGLWYGAKQASVNTVQRAFSVELGIRGQASNVVVVSELPKVNVIVEGRANMVDEVTAANLRAYVDISGLKSGTHELKVHASVIGTQHAPMLSVGARPPEIELELDYLTNKKFAVGAEFTDPPPPGYIYGPASIVPPSVTVSGTSTRVSKVAAVQLDTEGKIDLGSVPGRAYQGEFAVRALDSRGAVVSGVNFSVTKVQLSFTLTKAPSRGSLLVSAKIAALPEPPYKVVKVTVSPRWVTAQGSPSALTGAVAQTEPIDLSDARETVTREVRLAPTQGLRFEGSGRVRVTIEIEREEEPPPEGDE